MGHRKQSAPRHGSLAFRPRARFRRLTPRIRFWPEIEGKVRLLGFAGYRVGMTHGFTIDTSESSPFKGREVFTPITIIETPPLIIVGVRLYGDSFQGLRVIWENWAKTLPKYIERRITSLRNRKKESAIEPPKELVEKTKEVRVIVATQPYKTGIGKKIPEVFEIAVGGGNAVAERVSYALSILGKEVTIKEVFQEGSYVDVFAVTKGKGFEGVVKRFRVKILDRKSNKTRRGVATLGPWKPSGVMYTVPRPGQMGYMQRLVRNLRILRIVENPDEVNKPGGFHKYGVVRNTVVMLNGSVPGTPKRLVKLRISARKGEAKIEPPMLTYVNIRRPVAA
ncbi:MAG: 50S ribosomal protein L3 [Crenarchaeota archaeon]|nr:50S ribosomal protein L3 [Thermoproteota archaeon]MDW8033813.1 50S ribosomal protein L3 [Nitrososphaerota archaeon]